MVQKFFRLKLTWQIVICIDAFILYVLLFQYAYIVGGFSK